MNPKISVIIPVYNTEKYLRQCLDSVINQTYQNLEIIIIDDGSPDNCGVICDEYALKDDRIIVVHKQNSGLSAAWNDGVAMATGEWIAFVDSDDWCEVDYFEQLLTRLWENGQDVDIFCAGGCFKEYNDRTIEARSFTGPAMFKGREQIDFLIAKSLIGQCGDPKNKHVIPLGHQWIKLYKTAFIRQIQLKFDTRLPATGDILFSILAFDKINCAAVCDYIGYHYRQQVMTSITNQFSPQRPRMGIIFLNYLAEYMRHREPNKLIQNAITARGIREFLASCEHYFFHKNNKNPYRVTAKEINVIKKEPAFYDIVHNKSNRLLTKKQIVLKHLLRVPCVWPLKLYCDMRQLLHR